jgi:hypothetical protein
MTDPLAGLDFHPKQDCEYPLCDSPPVFRMAIRYAVIACPNCRAGETYPVCAKCYLSMIHTRSTDATQSRTWVCGNCCATITYRDTVSWEQIKHWL